MTKLYYPDPEFQKNANIKSIDEYNELWANADKNPELYWGSLALKKLNWIKKYDRVLNDEKAPFYSWFEGGKLNIADQCIDRHIDSRGDKVAIIWESESGDTKNITYKDMLDSVNKTANILQQDFGIKKGDRVVIYMPMIPEAIYSMLACARIGAIHVVVFGGFSAEVLRERIIDTQAKIVITADGSYRRGKPYMLKPIVDEALNYTDIDKDIKVMVVRHNNQTIKLKKNRDYDYSILLKNKLSTIESCVMNSEDISFILHTSGSTGKPKGIKHSTAGYILWAQYTTEIVFDFKKDDVFWCTADIGWITGHTYGVYGPLANGATILIYDGVPTFPDSGRWWSVIEKHKVNQFYTAPTAIRLLKKNDPDAPLKYDLSSLKVIGTVGEPIDPEAWSWYYKFIGNSRCPIVDTWWQTETGGHAISPLPGATPIKSGSATMPLPGISAEILDINGRRVGNGEYGFLCITKPWPSMLRSVWNDDNRYINSYYDVIRSGDDNKYIYFSGDKAFYDENGYIVVTGRTDDVMNISGHRINSAEIESAILSHAKFAEAAVVSCLDDISGEAVVAFIVPKGDYKKLNIKELDVIDELNMILARKIGPIIKIKIMLFVSGLPKTRSGKVLRHLLRTIARNEKITQDLSTIEDPSIIGAIQTSFDNLTRK